MSDFSSSEALRYGWQKTKGNMIFFIGSYIILGLLQIIPLACAVLAISKANDSNWSLAIAFGIATILSEIMAFLILFIGYAKSATHISNGNGPTFGDMKPTSKEMWRVFIAGVIWFIGIGIGLLFFIIPGIWFALTFWPFGWVIINKEVGPIEGLRQARQLTKGVKFQHFIFFVLCGLILAVGALCLGVGLILAFPITLIATTFCFMKISGLETAA